MVHYAGRPYQVVVHQYYSVAVQAYLLEHHLDQALAVWIQRAYRLVHYKDVRLHCQNRCYAHRLPLPSRKVCHAPCPQVLETKKIQHIVHPLGNLCLRYTHILKTESYGILNTIAEKLVLRVLAYYAYQAVRRLIKGA